MAQDEYVTPEGFTLPRRLLLPDVRTFGEVLEYVREWDHATMTHYSGKPGPERPEPQDVHGNLFDGFASLRTERDGRRSIHARMTRLTLDALEGELFTWDHPDHLGVKIIEHKRTGRALVVVDHNRIIGGRWLAYIDPASIPPARES